jgi:hypothetical protein
MPNKNPLSGNSVVELGSLIAGEDLANNRLNVSVVASVQVPSITKGGTVSETVTCTDANTDYAAGDALPENTKLVSVTASAAALIAIGEATSATVGMGINAGTTVISVSRTGTAEDDTIHAQSATAGATIRLTYLAV